MKIDIISLIIGAVLWELVQTYFNFYVIPSIKRSRTRRREDKVDRKTQQKPANYNSTNIGFNCQLKDEPK